MEIENSGFAVILPVFSLCFEISPFNSPLQRGMRNKKNGTILCQNAVWVDVCGKNPP